MKAGNLRLVQDLSPGYRFGFHKPTAAASSFRFSVDGPVPSFEAVKFSIALQWAALSVQRHPNDLPDLGTCPERLNYLESATALVIRLSRPLCGSPFPISPFQR